MNQDPINQNMETGYVNQQVYYGSEERESQAMEDKNENQDDQVVDVSMSQSLNSGQQGTYSNHINNQPIQNYNMSKTKNKDHISQTNSDIKESASNLANNNQETSKTMNNSTSSSQNQSTSLLTVNNPQQKQSAPITINVFQEKITKALQLKNEGNKAFKEKDFNKSAQYYQQSLRILDPAQFYGATQAECIKMAEISSQLLNNLGTCYFNSQDWMKAEIYYTQAITINPNYLKALWKRALARRQLGKHSEALEDIKKAYNLDKGNQEVYQAYEKIFNDYKDFEAEQKIKAKQLSQKMFDSQKKKSQKEAQDDPQQQPSNWNIAGIVAGIGLFTFGMYKLFAK